MRTAEADNLAGYFARKIMLRSACILLVLTYELVAASAAEEKPAAQLWGDLSGRFVLDGKAPVVAQLEKDGVVIRDETVVVDPKSGGIANVVVFLLPENDRPLAVHPSYAAAAKTMLKWPIDGRRFNPHVMTLRTTQSLQFENNDPMGHNPKLEPIENAAACALLPPTDDVTHHLGKGDILLIGVSVTVV